MQPSSCPSQQQVSQQLRVTPHQIGQQPPQQGQTYSAKQEKQSRSLMAATVITRDRSAGQAKKLSQQDDVRTSKVPGMAQAYLQHSSGKSQGQGV